MMQYGTWLGCVAGLLLAAGGTSTVQAQDLAARVAAVRDGRAQLRFASRPGVCGDGRGMISVGDNVYFRNDSWGTSGRWRESCQPGPVRVVLTVQGGEVAKLRSYVGGDESGSGVTDLGTISAKLATDYLLALARRTSSGRVGEDAIVASVLADSVTIWPALFPIARDETRPKATRASATFWLGRAAAAAASGTTLFASHDDDADDPDEDVRASAIFALSQQPREEGVPALIQVARTNRDPHLRGRALFWLGQTGDSRALDLFQELLRGQSP
jgi:hypothetical protein